MQRFLPFVLLVSSTLAAQTRTAPLGPAPEPPGPVTGHVYATDTNLPVRFAVVSLERMPDLEKSALAKASEATAPRTPATTPVRSVLKTYPTSLDGSFTVRDVAPGRYFVIVKKPGYIQPRQMFTDKMLRDPSSDMQKLIREALTEVTVDSNQAVQTEIRLQRGAEVSGHLLYDDGSPAGNISMTLLQKNDKGEWVNRKRDSHDFTDFVTSDDTGHFHFAALLPGEYLLQATLELQESTETTTGDPAAGHQMTYMRSAYLSQLQFFGAGTAFQEQAKPLTLTAGEQHDGVDMTLPVSKLVRVTGYVSAGASPHTINGATLELTPRGEKRVLATATISRVDGLFHFDFVPPGEYTLRVRNARDITWVPAKPNSGSVLPPELREPDEERVDARYGDTSQPITITGDQLGIIVNVPPDAKPTSSESATAKP